MIRGIIIFFILSAFLFGGWEDKININGFYSFEYENRIDSFAHDEGDPNGSFDSDLFDLVFNIKPSPNIRVAADLTWEHGSATEDNRGNVAVEYAFGEYMYNELLKFRAGKMYTAFGIYNEIHTAKPAMVNFKEPLTTNKIHKIGGDVNYFPRWGTGLGLYGNTRNIEYSLQITNGYMEPTGDDFNPYSEDDNANKAITARIKAFISGHEIAFSMYHDTFVDYNASDVAQGSGELKSYGMHAISDLNDNLTFQIEAIYGELQYNNSNIIERYSYSFMPVYDISDSIRIYYIYEYFDPNLLLTNDNVVINSFGLNVQIAPSTFIKSEIYYVNSKDANSKLFGNDYAEFRAAFVIGF